MKETKYNHCESTEGIVSLEEFGNFCPDCVLEIERIVFGDDWEQEQQRRVELLRQLPSWDEFVKQGESEVQE